MSIKDDPELQHVMAHVLAAIRYTSRGDHEAARYELDSIEGLVVFDTDEAFVGHARGLEDGETPSEPMQEKKPSADEAGQT